MKHIYIILFITIMGYGCQVEDTNTPTPAESYTKYYGKSANYEAKDIEFLFDSSGFMVFASVLNDNGLNDYMLLKINADGLLMDSISFSFDVPLKWDAAGKKTDEVLQGRDNASKVVVYDGGFAIIGTTSLNNRALDILDVRVATVGVFDDDFKLTLDTTFAATPNLTSGLDLLGSDVIKTKDGGIVILGSIEVDRGGTSDFDFYVQKIKSNNNFVETFGIIGEGNNDILVRGFEKPNGNLVLIGYSSAPSSLFENGGNNGLNVTYKELTSEGKLINSVSYGVDNADDEDKTVFNEVVESVIHTPSGFAITGTTTFSTEERHAFFMNLTNTGIYIAGDIITSKHGKAFETLGIGIVQTIASDYVILGNYPKFNIINELDQQESRAGEAMLIKVNQAGTRIGNVEEHYGTENGNDEAIDAVAFPNGKIVVLANTDFGGGVQLISLIKTDDNGKLEN